MNNMTIETIADKALYVTINGWVYYIDDTTGEQIMKKWKEE